MQNIIPPVSTDDVAMYGSNSASWTISFFSYHELLLKLNVAEFSGLFTEQSINLFNTNAL